MPELGVYLVNPALKRLDGGRFDMLRRIEIGFAGAESADVDPFGLHRLGFAIDRKRQGRGQLGGARGDFHGCQGRVECFQNGSASYWRA